MPEELYNSHDYCLLADEKIPSNVVFCPNCEKDVECIHTAELYECKDCGEDFAKYIVSRKPANSDVSVTQDVLTGVKTPSSIENTNPDYYKQELARIAELEAHIAELEAENERLKAENAALKAEPKPLAYWSDEKKQTYADNEGRSAKRSVRNE